MMSLLPWKDLECYFNGVRILSFNAKVAGSGMGRNIMGFGDEALSFFMYEYLPTYMDTPLYDL